MLIFISYRSADRELVETMSADLHGLGHTVWFDQELTGGHTWWNSILNSVQQCDLFIFALSPQSLDSYPCQLEYSYADALEKRILPVLLRDINAELLPPALSKIQFVDYRMQDKKASISLARALASLPPAQPLPDPLPPPPEAPISGLGKMKERIESSTRLSLDEQASLLLELKGFYQKADTRTTAQELFERFRRRSDLFASIDREIESILGTARAVSQPPPLVTKTISPPRTLPKVSLPQLSTEGRLRSWLWYYLWAAFGAFVFLAPLASLDSNALNYAIGAHVLSTLSLALGLLLARTLPIWLPQRFQRRLFGLGIILAFLIGLAFATVTFHYVTIYFGYGGSSAFPAIPLILGFVLGATWLRHRLRLRILLGALGSFGFYAVLIAMNGYNVSFPFVENEGQPYWDAAHAYYLGYAHVAWTIIFAVALACSLLVYWPELAQNKVAEVEK